METSKLNDFNLFDESDNEIDANLAQVKKMKRKLDFEKDTKDVKKFNSKDTDVCEKEITNLNETKNGIIPSQHSIKSTTNKNSKGAVETNQLWSIEETLFYPLGIRNDYIAAVNKSVLLIWGDLYVINFIIKKNPTTKRTKTTRVKFLVPNDEEIKDIQILEFNTLLLLKSGRMNYFGSSKAMHKLPWLDNVRCITAYQNGFSIIRLTAEQKLVLETYEDVVDMGKNTTGPLRDSFDITFDEQNLFNCGWTDEEYYLMSIVINESNLNILQLITRTTLNLDHQKEVHFFGVSGNVFALIPDITADSYNIEMLFSYVSNVAMMKFDMERKFFFVFLQCGVIDVWYMSSELQYLRHQTHCLGFDYTSFSYSEIRGALYLTDENEVVEVRFSNVEDNDELIIQKTYKAIPGILVCTWIEAIEQLVCLDSNNIFHQLTFDATTIEDQPRKSSTQPVIKTSEFEKFNELFELTPQRVEQLRQKSHIIEQLNELPKIIHHDIEQQYRKQELLAVSNKRRYYSTLLNAQLEFHIGATHSIQNDVVKLYTQNKLELSQRTLLALIFVEIKQNELFQNTIWQLHLEFEESNHIFTLPNSLLLHKLCIIVPLEMSSQKLLPEFHLHLYSFVSCAKSFVAIAIPVSIVINYETLANLFIIGKCSTLKSFYSQHQLEDVFKQFDNMPKLFPLSEIKCCIDIPEKFKIRSIFKAAQDDASVYDENNFELNFLGSKISVCLDTKESQAIFKSNDAASLFYLKILLRHVCEQQLNKTNTQNRKDAVEKLLSLQCNAEQLYGTLQNVEDNELNEKTDATQKLKHLKELYLKIREELSQTLF